MMVARNERESMVPWTTYAEQEGADTPMDKDILLADMQIASRLFADAVEAYASAEYSLDAWTSTEAAALADEAAALYLQAGEMLTRDP